MCYDVKTYLEIQLHKALTMGDQEKIKAFKRELARLTDLPLHHASAFQHPRMLIYTEQSPNWPVVAQWGLVPHWVKDAAQQKKIWNNTVNARGETLFEKPAFRDAAKSHHCIIIVEGFYEHHHHKGKTYPYFIHHIKGEPLYLAGIWSEWTDRETGEILNTFAIVTTEANPMMARIHNNPKLAGPRMPVILPIELADLWLKPAHEGPDRKAFEELITAYPEEELEAHTVHRLRGKDYPGNVEGISEKVYYPELASD